MTQNETKDKLMQAKELAQKIRQVAEECTRENKNSATLVELLRTDDLPTRAELFTELKTLFCTPTVPGIIARLQETLTPCQTLEAACTIAQRALVLVARDRFIGRTVAAPTTPEYLTQTLKETGRVMEWHAHLLKPIAIALGCVGVKVPGEALEITGTPHDINTVQTIFTFLEAAIERLTIDQPKATRPKWRDQAAHAVGEAAWEAYADLLLELRQARPLDLETVHTIAVHKETTKVLAQVARDWDERKRLLGERKGRRAVVLTRDHPKP